MGPSDLLNKLCLLRRSTVTGFIDGEGTFYVGVYPKSDMATGYQVSLVSGPRVQSTAIFTRTESPDKY